MNQAMPERLAVCFRGYICRGSPAAVKPESSSSACLQVRESRDFSRVEVSTDCVEKISQKFAEMLFFRHIVYAKNIRTERSEKNDKKNRISNRKQK